MAQNLVMRQLDERTTEQEVSLLLWSPKMDILAAGQIDRWLRRLSELLFAKPYVECTASYLIDRLHCLKSDPSNA
jgi:hypothetical protein